MLVRPSAGQFPHSPSSKNDEEQKGYSQVSENDLFNFLKSRAGKLDAVVISGGEPTIHSGLPEFIFQIKQLDFKVKLDTNGTNPDILEKLIADDLIDYVAMDVKGSEEKYGLVVGAQPRLNKIRKSIIIIKENNLPHEFRTTVAPGLVELDDIEKIGRMIRGADKWYLQQFKPDTELVNRKMETIKPHTDEQLEKMRDLGAKYAGECRVW